MIGREVMERYIINKKYTDLFNLIELGESRIRPLSQKINMTYIHIRQVLLHFQDSGFIKPVFNQNKEERDYKIQPTLKMLCVNRSFKFFKELESAKNDKETRAKLKEHITELSKI